MAEASKTVEMPVSREKLWKVITDYAKYPEFVDGAQAVKILSRDKGRVRVQYGIQLLGKDIGYVLDHFEEDPGSVAPGQALKARWELVGSNVLKANSGSWVLRDRGGDATEVTYQLELDFKIYVPGMILNGLVKSSLPKMLDNFESRAKKLG